MPSSRRGFVLLVTALILLSLAGVAGLSIDIGHLYAVRAEAQSYADSLALTAARELDGTAAGFERARRRMSAIPRTGFLKIAPRLAARTDYSSDGKTWETAPSRPALFRTVRVRVALDQVELFFLPAVIPNKTADVQVVSISEQQSVGAAPVAMLPFAIYARAGSGPDFGYKAGDPVTLRWTSKGAGCGGSVAGAEPGDGYIQGIARRQVRDAIENGRIVTPVEAGREIRMTRGDVYQMGVSLAERSSQDTNTTARTWADYQRNPGNLRRVSTVAVVSAERAVLGFVQVFLPLRQPTDDSAPLCAEYAAAGDQPLQRFARLVR